MGLTETQWRSVQIRSVDPYSSYFSDNVNKHTRIVSGGVDCIVNGLRGTIDTDYHELCHISSGICIKDDVMLQFTSSITLDSTDPEFYVDNTLPTESGVYYVVVSYHYQKVKPAPYAKILLCKPNHYDESYHLFLHAVTIDYYPSLSAYAFVNIYDYDPDNTAIHRVYPLFIGQLKGVPNGFASLDETAHIPPEQLWIDDNNISARILWSSQKISDELHDLENCATTIVGDIALEDGILEDGIVVEDIDDVKNLDNRVSQGYLEAKKVGMKLDVFSNTIQEQVSLLQVDIDNHEYRIANAEETINILQSDTTELKSEIANKVSVTTYNHDIENNLKPRVAQAEQNITTLYSQDDNLQAQIDQKVAIETYNADVTNDLKPRMSSAEQNISTLQSDVGELQSEINNKVSISTYENDQYDNEGNLRIAVAESRLNVHDNKLTELDSSITLQAATIVGDIALEEDIVEEGVVVQSIEDVQNLDNRISQNYLETKKVGMKLAQVEETISILQSDIYEDSNVLAKIKNVDGSGSGLDADLLDGQHGSFYRNASNLNAGTVPAARLSGTYSINISGNAATATNADKIDNLHASSFVRTDASTAPNSDNTYDVGSSSKRYKNIYAVNFVGTATTAKYADLAEKFTVKGDPKIGEVVCISEDDEYDCEVSNEIASQRVLGVISQRPAFKMNDQLENGYYVALKGRIKCKVFGKVKKGDLMVSYKNGAAISVNNVGQEKIKFGTIFAKALENKITDDYGYIEIVI